MLHSIVDRVLARTNLPLTPGSDDSKARVESLIGQLEAYLVIPFPGASVSHSVRALHFRNLHLATRNERSSKGSAQQVLTLVDRPRHQGRIDVAGDELFAQVFNVDRASTGRQRFLFESFQFLTLPQVRSHAYDLATVRVLEPGNDDRGIQPA